METPALPVIVISAALLLSYYFGVQGLAGVAGISEYAKGIYGTAIATMGMLQLRGVHPGHGYLRAHHGQRRRHYRDVGTSRSRSATGRTSWTRRGTRPRR